MVFTEPQPLTDLIDKLDAKTPIGSAMRTAEWQRVPQGLRDGAFFSAGVTHTQFLAQQQRSITDMIARARETNAAGESMWKMDRGQFVKQLRVLGEELGVQHPTGREGGIKENDLTDPLSIARLKLVVNTQLELAYGYGQYVAAMDEDVLQEWPAWELVRITPRKAPRDWFQRWSEAGGTLHDGRMIALKTDPIWAKLSRFGNPHPPFDFNSGMGVEEVDRDTVESLGLMSMSMNEALQDFATLKFQTAAQLKAGRGKFNLAPESQQPGLKAFQEGLESSVKGLDADMRERLRNFFGGQVEVDEATARWKPSPRHESPKARPQDRQADPIPDSDAARTRAAVEEVFGGVFDGWDSTADPESAALKTGIVGQIAAAAHGLKPLYYDAWGDKAAGIAKALRGAVPDQTKIVVNGSNLLIYRDEAVKPLLHGKGSVEKQIIKAVKDGAYGKLLGYGIEDTTRRPAVRVIINNAEAWPVVQFNAPSEAWQEFAAQRLNDLVQSTGRDDLEITPPQRLP
jgi:hypothetical protein